MPGPAKEKVKAGVVEDGLIVEWNVHDQTSTPIISAG